MSSYTSSTQIIAAAVVALSLALVVGGLLKGHAAFSRTRDRVFVMVAVAGLAFQVIHSIEHGAQLTYWMMHPAEKPWLTPWADAAAGGLKFFCSIVPGAKGGSIGVELLHLAGNTIFLGALWASMVCAFRFVPWASTRQLRNATIVQFAHVVEHVSLTVSVWVFGKPFGVSTMFGFLDLNTSFAGSYRVWLHFMINLVATWLAIRAVAGLRRAYRTGQQPVVESEEHHGPFDRGIPALTPA
ncbi:MAG: hypothetical protein KDB86_08885 [Actinobacteria bacterium]|nr:hypothetical protein [Actinomycetota bacterium]MCB9390547.1 hypothetical protein [Acidimicrobiia bacterium]